MTIDELTTKADLFTCNSADDWRAGCQLVRDLRLTAIERCKETSAYRGDIRALLWRMREVQTILDRWAAAQLFTGEN